MTETVTVVKTLITGMGTPTNMCTGLLFDKGGMYVDGGGMQRKGMDLTDADVVVWAWWGYGEDGGCGARPPGAYLLFSYFGLSS